MAETATAPTRIYTPLDDKLEHALAVAVAAGLAEEDAPRSEVLRALALYADESLSEAMEREERIAAYELLAQDEERLATINAWTQAAVEDGIL